jgi:hypothetical protein
MAKGLFPVVETATVIPDREKFHYIVVKLLYLGKRCRPDILPAVQFLCTRVISPTVQDEAKLIRVLGYLKLTKQWTRIFDSSPFERVQTYIDVSFAMHSDGKSQSACVVMLGNTLVHEACRKQKLITKSSTKVELVALSDYISEGELIEHFLMDLGHLLDDDLVTNVHLVYQDNQSTIALVKNGGGKPRSKYMKMQQEYVKESLGTSELEVEYVRTLGMLEDVLTKPIGGELYHSQVHRLLGCQHYLINRGVKSNTSSETSETAATFGTPDDTEPTRALSKLSCSNQCLHKHDLKPKESELPQRHAKKHNQ